MGRTSVARSENERGPRPDRLSILPAGLTLPGPFQQAVGATLTRVARQRDVITRHWASRYRELVGREWTPRERDLAPVVLARLHRALIRGDYRGYIAAIEEVAHDFFRERLSPERLLAFLEAHQEAVVQVMLGTDRVSPAVGETLRALFRIQHYSLWHVLGVYESAGDPRREKGMRDRRRRVTPRELQIIRHIAEGMTSKEIAEALGTSLKTVETHRQNIFRKLELSNAAQLVRYAIREGLVRA